MVTAARPPRVNKVNKVNNGGCRWYSPLCVPELGPAPSACTCSHRNPLPHAKVDVCGKMAYTSQISPLNQGPPGTLGQHVQGMRELLVHSPRGCLLACLLHDSSLGTWYCSEEDNIWESSTHTASGPCTLSTSRHSIHSHPLSDVRAEFSNTAITSTGLQVLVRVRKGSVLDSSSCPWFSPPDTSIGQPGLKEQSDPFLGCRLF